MTVKDKKGKHVANSKPAPLFKCRLCGDVIKVTKWRKHLAIKHNMQDLPKYHDYFFNESNQQSKCKICSMVIAKKEWSDHLLTNHNIGKKVIFKDYFEKQNHAKDSASKSFKVSKQWYDPDREPINKDWHCGDTLYGPPQVSVMYNAVCSKKRKH